MTDFIDGLERDLVAAARRRAAAAPGSASVPGSVPAPGSVPGPPGRTRWPLRTIAVALVLGTGTAGAAAAATLTALRGSVIPAPAAQDVPREQTPVPASGHVSALRVADPARGVPPWTVRTARSGTGYVCITAGQVSAGRFGLVGLDDRFRVLAPGIADSCGQEQDSSASLVGARVLAGRRPADVRTIVDGFGGKDLRRVDIESTRGDRRAPVAADGAFVAVLRGYPEDVGLRVRLTFADGHHQTESLGQDPSLVLDPAGGSAWRAQALQISGDGRLCSSFTWARTQPRQPRSPTACGRITTTRVHGRWRRTGVFFAVRRLSGNVLPAIGRGTPIFPGRWNHRPARTAVWGASGDDVRSVTVLGGPDGPVRARTAPGGTILAVLPGDVDPSALRVRVVMQGGRVSVTRGDRGLVDHALPATTTSGGGRR